MVVEGDNILGVMATRGKILRIETFIFTFFLCVTEYYNIRYQIHFCSEVHCLIVSVKLHINGIPKVCLPKICKF